MKVYQRQAFLLLLLSILACLPVMAQSGGLAVLVLDEEGTPLPGATVSLSNERGLITPIGMLTDSDGLAYFPVLHSGGEYAIEISMGGFGSQRRSGVRVIGGRTEKVEIRLTQPLEEVVEVLGIREIVDFDQQGSSSRFSSDFIEGLPSLGRFYQDLLTLAPGLKDEDGDGNPNVHGARSRDFRIEVGGVSNVDPLTGYWMTRINSDSIEELEILAVGAGVEYGRALGGFGRVLQNWGSNEQEISLNLLYRGSILDGDGASDFTGALAAPDFDSYEISLQLSGPIVKDKLFYRFSHEVIDQENPINLSGAIEVSTLEQKVSADQITWQASPRNRISFQFQTDPLTQTLLGLTSTVDPSATHTFERAGETYTLNWTAARSAQLLVNSIVSYQDLGVDILPTDPDAMQQCMAFHGIRSLNNALCFDTFRGTTTGAFSETSRDHRQRLTVKSQATIYKKLKGQSHQIKTGFLYEGERYFRDLERRPQMSMEVFFGLNRTAVAHTKIFLPLQSSAEATGNNWAIFIEDQWKPLPGLNITAGLRFDREEIDSIGFTPIDPDAEAAEYFRLREEGLPFFYNEPFTSHEDPFNVRDQLSDALQHPTSLIYTGSMMILSDRWTKHRTEENFTLVNTNYSPRISIGWDPWLNGKTRFSLTAGRYYDKIFLAVPLIEREPVEIELAFHATDVNRFLVNTDRQLLVLPVSAKQVDRNLLTPYQDELSFQIERALWTESSISVMYIERRYRDQFQDVDINHLLGDPGIPGTNPFTDTDSPLYTRNPGWNEILQIGNFNSSDYQGMVLDFERRFYQNWELQSSYTWSKIVGDAEDYNLLLGTEVGRTEQERGFLNHDQRHVFRLQAFTITPWGFRAGTVLRWESGLPYSLVQPVSFRYLIPGGYIQRPSQQLLGRLRYPTGQRNDQRNPSFWTVDLRISKDFEMARDTQVQLSLDIVNILNDDTLKVLSQTSGRNSSLRPFGRMFQIGMKMQF
jgi:outer membrane receptor protein involved in Fe transport